MKQINAATVMRTLFLALLLSTAGYSVADKEDAKEKGAKPSAKSDGWQQDFGLDKLTLESTGESKFFVLKPGYQIVLANKDAKVTITVLDKTEKVGNVTTRVVEEREEKNGKIVEVSRNFFAIAKETGDVFYFGEESDDYKDGKVVGQSGSWRADGKDCKPGMVMQGTPVLGAKYYMEFAPGKAMDRAENVSLTEKFKTPDGTFENCLRTKEG